jgi:hypothetical protein
MHADGEELVLQKAAPEDSNFTVAAIPEGRELQYASIADVTGNLLAKLTLEEVAAGPAAAATPVAVVEFRTFDGLVVTVTATAADADADADEPWLSFVASVDADATSPPEDAEASNAADVAAEASAINGRLAGWRYRIPAYKYTQLTRRMDDLLRDLPVTDE